MSEPGSRLAWAPEYCRHCFGCTAACPREALTVDAVLGILRYDIKKCIRCGSCLRACTTGALHVEARDLP